MIGKEIIRSITHPAKQPKILVIGDAMVDHYVWGSAKRLSPEAPVPVVNVENETTTLGGAANVAHNLVKLNAAVSLCCVVGNDDAGKQLMAHLQSESVNTDAVATDASRPTTIKTRVIAGSHQLLRVDKESTQPVLKNIEAALLTALYKKAGEADIVLLSDYNKGIFTKKFTQAVISLCNKNKKRVVIDPKGLHYEKYTGAWLIKPNKRELAEAAVVEKIDTDKDLAKAARKLLITTKSNYLVVTRSEEGLALISKTAFDNFPVKATEVFDVTGAGDTVFASLGYFLALGIDIKIACELANYAAAIAVSRVGSVAVTIEEIISALPQNKK